MLSAGQYRSTTKVSENYITKSKFEWFWATKLYGWEEWYPDISGSTANVCVFPNSVKVNDTYQILLITSLGWSRD